ncbi:MAG: FecR domain-containing protein [Oligoflexia bacterium]|nr:FecR domain-containing protein [Oligoflexia bacterium]
MVKLTNLKSTNLLLIILCTFVFITQVQAQTNYVAKVLMMKGKVSVTDKSTGKIIDLKNDDRLFVGNTIKTAEKSFAKLLFVDKSQVTVGPASEMNITEYPKNNPGVISLIKGQIRSQVTKNFAEKGDAIKDSEENKLFIKTQSAAMGVRGTDFQTIYNPTTEMTSVITFEGSVKMVQLEAKDKEIVTNSQELRAVVNSEKAVTVTEGQFAGANPKQEQVSIPVKISPAQLESMKNSNVATTEGSGAAAGAVSVTTGKTFGSPIPPGVPSKIFVNTESTKNVEKQLGSEQGQIGGPGQMGQPGQGQAGGMRDGGMQPQMAQMKADPPPEGFFDKKSGAFAPPAGGFVDVQTGFYLPPPPGSAFDPNTGVYVPPPTAGKFDPATGNYLPPQGLKLTESGQFVRAEPPPGMMGAQGGPQGGPQGMQGQGQQGMRQGPDGKPITAGQFGPGQGGPAGMGQPGMMMGQGPGMGPGMAGGPQGMGMMPGQPGQPGPAGMPGQPGMMGGPQMGMNNVFIPQVLNFGDNKAPMFVSPNDPMMFQPMRVERVFNDPSNPMNQPGMMGPMGAMGPMGPGMPGMGPMMPTMSDSMLNRIDNIYQQTGDKLQTGMVNASGSTTAVKVMIDLSRP